MATSPGGHCCSSSPWWSRPACWRSCSARMARWRRLQDGDSRPPCTVVQQVSVGLDLNLPVGTSVARVDCDVTRMARQPRPGCPVGWVLRLLAWCSRRCSSRASPARYARPDLCPVAVPRPLRKKPPTRQRTPACQTSSIRIIRARLRAGQPRAQQARARLAHANG